MNDSAQITYWKKRITQFLSVKKSIYGPFLRLFVLLLVWFSVNLVVEYARLRNEITRKMMSWSEDIGREYVNATTPSLKSPWRKTLSRDHRYQLSTLPLHQLPWYQRLLANEVPISYYTIPAGTLSYRVIPAQLILSTLKSSGFLAGSLIISLLVLLVEILALDRRFVLKEQERDRQNMIFRDQLITQVIHDLKSPLTLLKSLMSTPLNNQDYLFFLRQLDHRFEQILNELKTKNSTDLPYLQQNYPLSLVVSEIQNLCAQVEQQSKQKIIVDHQINSHSDLHLHGHLPQIIRAIENLLVNAAEANQKNHQSQIHITFQILFPDMKKSTPHLKITIRDFGKGFIDAKKYLSFLGSPWSPQYADQSLSLNQRGVGLRSALACISWNQGQLDIYPLKAGNEETTSADPHFLGGTVAEVTFPLFFHPSAQYQNAPLTVDESAAPPPSHSSF